MADSPVPEYTCTMCVYAIVASCNCCALFPRLVRRNFPGDPGSLCVRPARLRTIANHGQSRTLSASTTGHLTSRPPRPCQKPSMACAASTSTVACLYHILQQMWRPVCFMLGPAAPWCSTRLSEAHQGNPPRLTIIACRVGQRPTQPHFARPVSQSPSLPQSSGQGRLRSSLRSRLLAC